MKIFGLEKMSLVDYDGKVCATVFTGKCNFRCGFCHNATLVVDYDKLPAINENDIFDYLKKRQGILDGLCISGGEPTLCNDLPEFCEKVKKLGYPIKLDTNGTNFNLVKYLHENKLVDYFAMDIKNSRENYGQIIDIPNFDTKNVEKTVEYFLTSNVDYEFRTTLIREYHTKEDMVKIGEWIKGANKYFLQKFKNGENCLTQVLNDVPIDTAKEFLEIVSKSVKYASLRGYE